VTAKDLLAIFDGDDTLWEVERLYDAALDRAAELVAAAGLPPDEWRVLQRQMDLEHVLTMGMSPERFPLSSAMAVEEVARRHQLLLATELRDDVAKESRSVFTATAPLAPAAEAVLRRLHPHCHLALLTKGDRAVQERRIESSGLAELFDRIEIVDAKSEAMFVQLAARFDVRPDEAWSIGNSLASDINPALRAGLRAIWIDAHVWEYERREAALEHPDLVILDDLRAVPDIVLSTLTGSLPAVEA